MYLKSILGLAFIYLVLGPVLLFSDIRLLDADAVVATRGIIGMAVCFFVFTIFEMALLSHVGKKFPDYLLSVIIGGKGLRIFFTCLAILAYGLFGLPEFIAFTVNIFIFYIATMVFDTVFNMMKNKNLSR